MKWQYNIPGYEQSFRGVAIADINNDLFPDVIFGTDGGKVIALNGNNGSLIWSVDLATHYGNPDFALDHAPLVADFDGDDTLDVFIVGGHAEYPNFQNDFGRAYMISAGKGNGPDWLMFQNDLYRQSSLCKYVPSALSAGAEPVTAYVCPNPFSLETTLQLERNINDATLKVYNSHGQVVRLMNHLSGQTIIFQRNDLPDGIYFIILQEDHEIIVSKKLVIVGRNQTN